MMMMMMRQVSGEVAVLLKRARGKQSALSKLNRIQTRDLRSDRFSRGTWITGQTAQTRVVARFNASAGRPLQANAV